MLLKSSWSRKCYHAKESSLEQMAHPVLALVFRFVTICASVGLLPHHAEIQLLSWRSRNSSLSQLTLQGIAKNYYVKLNTKDLFKTTCIGGSFVIIFLFCFFLNCYLTLTSIHIPHLFPTSIGLALGESTVINLNFSTLPRSRLTWQSMDILSFSGHYKQCPE